MKIHQIIKEFFQHNHPADKNYVRSLIAEHSKRIHATTRTSPFELEDEIAYLEGIVQSSKKILDKGSYAAAINEIASAYAYIDNNAKLLENVNLLEPLSYTLVLIQEDKCSLH